MHDVQERPSSCRGLAWRVADLQAQRLAWWLWHALVLRLMASFILVPRPVEMWLRTRLSHRMQRADWCLVAAMETEWEGVPYPHSGSPAGLAAADPGAVTEGTRREIAEGVAALSKAFQAASTTLKGLNNFTTPRQAKALQDRGYISDPPPMQPGERTIASMWPGESGWSVPWMLDRALDGSWWLNPDGPVHAYQAGTARMAIYRSKDGFQVVRPASEVYQRVKVDTRHRIRVAQVVRVGSPC
jgi:hypothetical protein